MAELLPTSIKLYGIGSMGAFELYIVYWAGSTEWSGIVLMLRNIILEEYNIYWINVQEVKIYIKINLYPYIIFILSPDISVY